MPFDPRPHLPTIAELRALWVGRRGLELPDAWLDDGLSSREADPALLAMLEDPFESVEDVADRLDRMERHLRDLGDRRSVFLTVYAAMTERVRAGIESSSAGDAGDGSGSEAITFEHPDWVRAYLVAFAERYRRALLSLERGSMADVPPAWRLAFNASTAGETLLIQDALLGINAHINHDLSYALRDVGIDPERAAKRRDHDRINAILERLVDVVQRALVEVYEAEGYRQIDAGLGRFDETFTLVALTESRTLAWRNAVALTDTGLAVLERLVHWRIRLLSVGAGAAILAPSADPALLEAFRLIEEGDPPLDDLHERFTERLFKVGHDFPRS